MVIPQQAGLARNVLRKLRSALHAVRVERFYVLDGPPKQVQTKLPVEIRCVTSYGKEIGRDLSRIKGFEANWKHRFDLAHRCYLTFCNGAAVGYGWVSNASWFVGLERPMGPLANDVAYIYDEITMTPFRGNRLGPARLAFMANDMAQRGLRRSCQLIADDNVPSQRSAHAAGYHRTRSIVRVHRLAHCFRLPEGLPPKGYRSDDATDYFANATAHYVLGRS